MHSGQESRPSVLHAWSQAGGDSNLHHPWGCADHHAKGRDRERREGCSHFNGIQDLWDQERGGKPKVESDCSCERGAVRPVPPQHCAEAACCEETSSIRWLRAGCSSNVCQIWSLRGGRCLLASIGLQFRQEIGVSLLQTLLGMCHSRTGASWRTETRHVGSLDWAAAEGGLW